MINPKDVYRIGRIGKPHGVKGELSFQFTDDVFDRVEAEYVVLETDGILVPFFIEDYRFRNEATALVKFEGVDDEHRARELTHSEVFFPYALADDNEQQLSWAAFIGFQLIDGRTDCVVGEICDIEDSTINVVFHVKTAEGREVLIPAASELIQDVNQHDRQIEIMLPDGILDI